MYSYVKHLKKPFILKFSVALSVHKCILPLCKAVASKQRAHPEGELPEEWQEDLNIRGAEHASECEGRRS